MTRLGNRSTGRGTRAICLAVVLAWLTAPLLAVGAHAEIVQRLPADELGWLPLLSPGASPGRERILVVNGVVLRTRVSTSPLAPELLLDQLQAALETRLAAAAVPMAAESPRSIEEAGARAQQAIAAVFRQPFRTSGPGWGALGRLVGGDPGEIESLLSAIGEAGAMGSAGAGGFLVLAMAVEQETWVFATRFDEDFDPLALVGAHPGDVGGGDVPGLARFPGTRRSLTFSEFSAAPSAHIVGYLGDGSVKAHAAHWRDRFRILGLDALDVPLDVPGRVLLVGSGEGREVAIYVSRDGGSGEVLDLIQVRKDEPRGSTVEVR